MSPTQHQDLCLLPVVVVVVAAPAAPAAAMQVLGAVRTEQCNKDQHLKQLLRLLQHSPGNGRLESGLDRVREWPREASCGFPGKNCPPYFSTAVMGTPTPALARALTAAVTSAMLRPQCTATR